MVTTHKYLIRLATALALTLMLLAPSTARADHIVGSLDFTSSMGATCVTADCSLIRFMLTGFQYDVLVDKVRLFSHTSSGSPWVFDEITKAWTGEGTVLYDATATAGTTLWSATNPAALFGGLYISGGGSLAVAPIYIEVRMLTWGTFEQLHDGSLTYSANGLDATGHTFSTSGTVNPEPFTLLLVGSGLVGIAGAARRRKQRLLDG